MTAKRKKGDKLESLETADWAADRAARRRARSPEVAAAQAKTRELFAVGGGKSEE